MTFNATVTTQVVELYIIDDDIVEHSEVLNLILRSTDSAVLLNPSTTTITIEDVESKLLYVYIYICKRNCSDLFIYRYIFTTSAVTIGFSRTAYSVSEGAGSVSVTASVQNRTLDRDVIVTLSTVNGSALCESLKSTLPQWVVSLASLSMYSMCSLSHFSSWDRL